MGRAGHLAAGIVLAGMACIAPAVAADAVCAGQAYKKAPNGVVACSKHFIGYGTCDGQDQLPIKAAPWEPKPISIVGVTVGLITHPPTKMAYIFAGNSAVHDIMAFQAGAGSNTVMYPPGFTFQLPAKGAPDGTHVDAHVSCNRRIDPTPAESWLGRLIQQLSPKPADVGAHNYQAWLIVYYTIP